MQFYVEFNSQIISPEASIWASMLLMYESNSACDVILPRKGVRPVKGPSSETVHSVPIRYLMPR